MNKKKKTIAYKRESRLNFDMNILVRHMMMMIDRMSSFIVCLKHLLDMSWITRKRLRLNVETVLISLSLCLENQHFAVCDFD